MITPNQTKAETLTGVAVHDIESAAKAAAILHEKGIEAVVITMGSQGAFVSESSTQTSELVAGFKAEPVNTTVAGDTFNGDLLVALAEGQTLIEAAKFANACGALSVLHPGAQTSIPIRGEVTEFMEGQYAFGI